MSNKAKKQQHHQDDEDEESGNAPNSDLTSKLVSGGGSSNNNNNNQNDQYTGCCPLFSIKFWRRYFNVNQSDVSQRIKCALFLTPPFEEVLDGRPDLYGPLWIYTTIIALVSICANICTYLNQIGDSSTFTYEFKFVPVAASLIFGVGLITPTVLWVIVKLLFKIKISLIETICYFGYSEACFVIISVLSMIPSTLSHWLLLIYGFASSTIFFFRSSKKSMEELDVNQRYVVIGIVGGCQLILCLMFRFYFFKLTSSTTTTS